MPESTTCPKCGARLPGNAPSGICPRCLMQAGLAGDGNSDASDSVNEPATTAAHSAGFVPPNVELLGPHFPQLEITELLGHGGMGAVYKARQTQLDRVVALKIMRPGSANESLFAQRFNREAHTLLG